MRITAFGISADIALTIVGVSSLLFILSLACAVPNNPKLSGKWLSGGKMVSVRTYRDDGTFESVYSDWVRGKLKTTTYKGTYTITNKGPEGFTLDEKFGEEQNVISKSETYKASVDGDTLILRMDIGGALTSARMNTADSVPTPIPPPEPTQLAFDQICEKDPADKYFEKRYYVTGYLRLGYDAGHGRDEGWLFNLVPSPTNDPDPKGAIRVTTDACRSGGLQTDCSVPGTSEETGIIYDSVTDFWLKDSKGEKLLLNEGQADYRENVRLRVRQGQAEKLDLRCGGLGDREGRSKLRRYAALHARL
jgi:hypothetical protein